MNDVPALEARYLAPTYKRAPMVFARGEGVYLYDQDGRQYLDFLAGIAVNALGHAHPAVTQAIRDQAGTLVHTSNLFHTEPHVLLARDLVEASFADRVFFCNSGTEANEGALKFARKWTGKTEFVAFNDSFHGRSMGALAVTGTEKYRAPFEPLVPGVHWAVFNDADSALRLIGPNTAAVIVEPIQGEGGITLATPEFLRALREACDAHGAALIFDEVQCGLGRTGTLWAYEASGVTPDMMTLAKPLGGGLPIGAILMRQAVADVLAPGDHGSTFAAGPLVTHAARVVFNIVNQPEFLSGVREVGAYLGDRLRGLRHEAVVEVRGLGLMWGVQLQASTPAAEVLAAGYREGVVLGSAGNNTLRIVPPLIVGREHVDTFVDALSRALVLEPAKV
jgi:acetylornithine/N-succinyldiaminopimelate aminotransferase